MTTDFGVATPSRTVVLVDLSNFAHACWWPAVSAEKQDPTLYKATEVLKTNLEGKLRTMGRSFAEEGIQDPVICFVEDRLPKKKFELFPLYKANREPSDVDFKPLVKQWLLENGYNKFVWSEDAEADDAIASMVEILCEGDGVDVIVASSDKDLWVLMDPPYVRVYNLTKNQFVTMEDVADKFYGINNPECIALCKALWGDKGDNVPNVVPRMQKQLVPLIIESKGDIERFFELTETATLTDRCREILNGNRKQVMVNWLLVRLQRDCEFRKE